MLVLVSVGRGWIFSLAVLIPFQILLGESSHSAPSEDIDIPVFIPCELTLKSIAGGHDWSGEIQLGIATPQNEKLKVTRIKEVMGLQSRSHFKVSDAKPLFKEDLAFIQIDAEPRKTQREGFAYRAVVYPSYDPLSIRETFFVMEGKGARHREPMIISRENVELEQMDAVTAMNEALFSLIPQGESTYWTVLPVYGKSSPEAALAYGLERFSHFDEIIHGPRMLTEEEILQAAGENEEVRQKLQSLMLDFRKVYSSQKLQSGYFGAFSEKWFAAKGSLTFETIKLNRTSVFKVVSIGPMHYIYAFIVDSRAPQSTGKKQK